jgi:DNA-binding NarL/FixJ family response regulator
MPVKILIVDDHEIVRQGIRSILQARPHWEICGEAGDGQEAIRLAKELHPDAVILDVTMPVMGGLAAAVQIVQLNFDAKVLIFTMHDSTTLIKLVQQSGAHGLVLKSQAGHNLVKALEAVLSGQTFFPSNEEGLSRELEKVT